MQAVLGELPEHLRPLVSFLALTGWPASEAKGLRWAQVDQAGGVVRLEVGATKTGAGRVFPFAAHPALAALIRAQQERTSALERERDVLCPWVFHRNGRPIRNFHVAWRAACDRAGMGGRLVHDLRGTAARDLVRSGVPERLAMALLGHEADLADSVRKLAVYGASVPPEARQVVAMSRRNDSRTSTERAQSRADSPDAADVPTT